jgi:hypothetical protein
MDRFVSLSQMRIHTLLLLPVLFSIVALLSVGCSSEAGEGCRVDADCVCDENETPVCEGVVGQDFGTCRCVADGTGGSGGSGGSTGTGGNGGDGGTPGTGGTVGTGGTGGTGGSTGTGGSGGSGGTVGTACGENNVDGLAGLHGSVTISQTTVQAGNQVDISFAVNAFTLEYVWRFSDGTVNSIGSGSATTARGETVDLTFTVEDAPPGTYQFGILLWEDSATTGQEYVTAADCKTVELTAVQNGVRTLVGNSDCAPTCVENVE